ncbi:MAG: MarR family transcriptional regulator, partial [Alphaproteobacteria bacterium]|nr:MarR family transcriptional regulator [Alphaproteobacteria bacterium]
LCFSVYATGHAFTRVYKPLLDDLGLTYPQYLVLVSLWEQDNQTVGSLGKMLHLESNTLTPLLKRLESMALVHRRRDSKDERQVRIALTEAGSTMRDRAAKVPQCIKQATGMELADLQRLQTEIETLRAHLDQFTQGS